MEGLDEHVMKREWHDKGMRPEEAWPTEGADQRPVSVRRRMKRSMLPDDSGSRVPQC